MAYKETRVLKASTNTEPYIVRDLYRLYYGSTRVRRVHKYSSSYRLPK
jgi:hypothetical protein